VYVTVLVALSLRSLQHSKPNAEQTLCIAGLMMLSVETGS